MGGFGAPFGGGWGLVVKGGRENGKWQVASGSWELGTGKWPATDLVTLRIRRLGNRSLEAIQSESEKHILQDSNGRGNVITLTVTLSE